jgi:hypothetical protein
MTDQTHPSGGGAYIRHPDGRLERLEETTVTEAQEAPVEAPVEAAVKAPSKRAVKEA